MLNNIDSPSSSSSAPRILPTFTSTSTHYTCTSPNYSHLLSSLYQRQNRIGRIFLLLTTLVLVYLTGYYGIYKPFKPQHGLGEYPPNIQASNPPNDFTLLSTRKNVLSENEVAAVDTAPKQSEFPIRWRETQTEGKFTIVTACDASLFFYLENLIGSVHQHTPNHLILVYDLGLTAEQLIILGGVLNTIVVSQKEWYLSRSDHLRTSHLLDTRIGAYRPVVILDALERMKQNDVLYLEPTQELTDYPYELEKVFAKNGYFFVINERKGSHLCCGTVGEITPAETYEYLHVKREEYQGAELVTNTVQGYSQTNKEVINSVLRPTATCALSLECIAPNQQNSTEQSVLSIHIKTSSSSSSSDLYIESRVGFWGNKENIQTIPELELTVNQTLFTREISHASTKKALEEWHPNYHTGKYRPTLPYSDVIIKEVVLAQVIPFIAADIENLRYQWNLNLIYQPCILPTKNKVDLIFFLNGFPNKTIENLLTEMVDQPQFQRSRACWRHVYMQYGRLLSEQEGYPTGANFMFDRLVAHKTVGLRQYGYTHFFLGEADTLPIRQLWLDKMFEILLQPQRVETSADGRAFTTTAAASSSSPLPYTATSWWVYGTMFRGEDNLNSMLLHINGNGLYHLTSSFISYTQLIWTEIDMHVHAYDLALIHYFWGFVDDDDANNIVKQYETQELFHKFKYTDYIQNCWHHACAHQGPMFLINYPFTYLVHTSINSHHKEPMPWWQKKYGKFVAGVLVWIVLALIILKRGGAATREAQYSRVPLSSRD